MTAFNAWYYSFSPYVAAYLSNHWIERTVMKGALYPLIGILGLSSATYSMTNAYPEMAALLSGLVASSLIGAFYVGLPLGVLRAKIRRLRGNRSQEIVTKALGIAVIAGLLALTVGELLVSPITLMISSSIIVLSTLLLAASVTSATLARRIRKLG